MVWIMIRYSKVCACSNVICSYNDGRLFRNMRSLVPLARWFYRGAVLYYGTVRILNLRLRLNRLTRTDYMR